MLQSARAADLLPRPAATAYKVRAFESLRQSRSDGGGERLTVSQPFRRDARGVEANRWYSEPAERASAWQPGASRGTIGFSWLEARENSAADGSHSATDVDARRMVCRSRIA